VLILISLAVAYGTIGRGAFGAHGQAFAAPITGLSLPGVGSSVPSTSSSVLTAGTIPKTRRGVESAAIRPRASATPALGIAGPDAPAPSPTPTATAQLDAINRTLAPAPTPEPPLATIYIVQEGDTVAGIAAKTGIDEKYIIANNVEIVDPNRLSIGQALQIPSTNGIIHEVRYGETLSDIAVRYDVDIQAIVSYSPNHIASADDVPAEKVVLVPGGRPIVSARDLAPNPTATEDGSTPSDTTTPGSSPTDSPTDTPAPNTGGPSGSAGSAADGGRSGGGGTASSKGLVWPVYGPISSYYGPSHPLGIDIDGFNLVGHAVVAATSGTVIFAGGNACCSYGLYVVIMSPDGIETLYAHLSSIYVSQGETISQGEAIGVIGSTGYSTGTHLHFEVIDNGVRVNPLSYLP
jgi:murein DD-endopeptidase MepM/ murein hydrolase activator NlpD